MDASRAAPESIMRAWRCRTRSEGWLARSNVSEWICELYRAILRACGGGAVVRVGAPGARDSRWTCEPRGTSTGVTAPANHRYVRETLGRPDQVVSGERVAGRATVATIGAPRLGGYRGSGKPAPRGVVPAVGGLPSGTPVGAVSASAGRYPAREARSHHSEYPNSAARSRTSRSRVPRSDHSRVGCPVEPDRAVSKTSSTNSEFWVRVPSLAIPMSLPSTHPSRTRR